MDWIQACIPDWDGYSLDERIGDLVWRDCIKDGEPVTAPVDIEALPAGKYRLV